MPDVWKLATHKMRELTPFFHSHRNQWKLSIECLQTSYFSTEQAMLWMKGKITSIDSYRIQFANQGVERSWLTPRCLFSTPVSWLYVKVTCGLRVLVIGIFWICRSWSWSMRICSLQSFFFDNPSFNNDFRAEAAENDLVKPFFFNQNCQGSLGKG